MGVYLLLMRTITAWVTAWKKKNPLFMLILTNMATQDAMMSRKTMMLSARIVLRITYPGPAKDSLSFDIMAFWPNVILRRLSAAIERDDPLSGLNSLCRWVSVVLPGKTRHQVGLWTIKRDGKEVTGQQETESRKERKAGQCEINSRTKKEWRRERTAETD